MRKLLTVIAIFISLPILAESEFSGNAGLSIAGIIPKDDYKDYLKNVYYQPSLNMEIAAWDDKSSFEALFSVAESEGAPELSLLRLYGDYSPMDQLTLSIGRKSYFLGYGYGWNPIDNLNPLKDPMDPEADLKGLDSFSVNWNYDYFLNIRAVSIIGNGANFDDLDFAADINFVLEGFEATVTGYLADNDSTKENSIALGVKGDILGAGLYGELIYLDYSDYKLNFLIGAEYLFETDTNVVIEYFYNDTGLDKKERKEFMLVDDPSLALYPTGYYTKQYLLLNINQELYDFNSAINLTGIYSIDSTALVLSPEFKVYATENMDLSISYSWVTDFTDDDYTEYDRSPGDHYFGLTYNYSF